MKKKGYFKSVVFTKHQWPIVEAAVEKIRKEASNISISRTRAIELILANFLSQ